MNGTGVDITFRGVGVSYPGGVRGLQDIDLRIPAGEMVAVVGLSGAGKSTLVRTINGLVPITEGEISVGDRRLAAARSVSGARISAARSVSGARISAARSVSGARISAARSVSGARHSAARGRELRELRSEIGMVFQSFNLARRTTVLNNVLMGRLHTAPTWRTLLGAWSRDDVELAMQALERVGIVDKAYVKAGNLSGGQQQRVAIARTLAQQPKIVLADEPVASLDPPTSHTVMRDLERINVELGITVVVNLHFLDLARRYGRRLIGLRGGKIVFDGTGEDADEQAFADIYGRSLTGEDVLEAQAVL